MVDVQEGQVGLRKSPQRRRSSLSSSEQTCSQQVFNFLNNGYVKLIGAILFFFLCIIYYQQAEDWSVVECILFVIVTTSTVGYGNIHPTSDDSRAFTIFLMLIGVFVLFAGLSSYINDGIRRMNQFLAKSVTSRLKRTELLFQRRVALSVVWVVACALFGALIFRKLEGWSYLTALYFVVQTMATVGFGDIAFSKQSTQIFLCFFIVLSTVLLSLAINNIYALIENRKVLSRRKTMLKLQRKLHFLADLNDGRGVNKFEFVLTILEHIGTLDHDKDIAPWIKKFEELDTYGNGILDQQQLAQFSEQNARECTQEIEEITLSTTNVEALPVASRSALSDFRMRAMTMGMFTDAELYQAESAVDDELLGAEEEDGDLQDGDGFEDGHDGDSQAVMELTASGRYSPKRRTRYRSSTVRKYSTATNLSDEEEGGSSGAESPFGSMLGWMGAALPLREPAQRRNASRDGVATTAQARLGVGDGTGGAASVGSGTTFGTPDRGIAMRAESEDSISPLHQPVALNVHAPRASTGSSAPTTPRSLASTLSPLTPPSPLVNDPSTGVHTRGQEGLDYVPASNGSASSSPRSKPASEIVHLGHHLHDLVGLPPRHPPARPSAHPPLRRGHSASPPTTPVSASDEEEVEVGNAPTGEGVSGHVDHVDDIHDRLL